MTYETHFRLERFVGALRRLNNALTNHALGFRKAFEMIWKSLGIGGATGNATEDPDEALIVYISRGLLSSLTDAKDILKAIALENGRMGHRVVRILHNNIMEGLAVSGVVELGDYVRFEFFW